MPKPWFSNLISASWRIFFSPAKSIASVLLVVGLMAGYVPLAGAGVTFDTLHGTDLGMGTGARAMALGGAFVALADDATAVYWNPAGLTQLTGLQMQASFGLPDEFSSAALVVKPKVLNLASVDLAVGLATVNRLRFDGDSGDEQWEGFAAHLLDLSMIDVGDDYAGRIDSTTTDTRFSLALRMPGLRDLSLGFNLVRLD